MHKTSPIIVFSDERNSFLVTEVHSQKTRARQLVSQKLASYGHLVYLQQY